MSLVRNSPANGDPIRSDDERKARIDAELGSIALAVRLNKQFKKESSRIGVSFEDARLLLNNGVKLAPRICPGRR